MKWIATSAQYSKKKALDIIKFKKANPFSFGEVPKFKVEKEIYRGKFTGRWTVLQDAKTAKLRFALNGF